LIRMTRTLRHGIRIALCAALAVVANVATAQTQDIAYVVTYVEVTPAAAAQALRMLAQQRERARTEDGNVAFEVLQRGGRRNQFVVLEEWRDSAAQTAHTQTPQTREFLEMLAPLRISPYDERPHTALSVAGSKQSDATLYAVTHVDIIPTSKEIGIELVEDFASASRADPGNVRFDVLTQNSRPNHMTVIELWTNEKSQQAHAAAAHTKKFRDSLLPLSGSLYDERLYRAVR
jgi:quinol monooxygenase YgiN